MTPFIIVIFGATGDLARNKLVPALFDLYKSKQLGDEFFIIGFARRAFTDEAFAAMFTKNTTDPLWNEFAKHLSYQQGIFEDVSGYQQLITKLEAIDTKMGACVTRIFYLATPPQNYLDILTHLYTTKLSEGCGQGSAKWTRIAIEKPFGKDLTTAKMLDEKLSEIFDERQIFRVDHYLAKETVQNMLIFRFANSIFEPVWNNQFIDHVQITWKEKKGIAGRGKFFDGIGMLRDMVQNHMMQLIATVTMEMPRSFSKVDVRDQRVKAIQAIESIDPEDVAENVIRGQYIGYKNEQDVVKDSTTETYVATKFFVNTPRFAGVPFYFRIGKSVDEDAVTISLVFKQTCHILFKEIGCPEEGNILTIRIQPNEGLFFRIIAKKPGTKLALENAEMHFSYHEQFGTHGAEAYQKLLLDILAGDQMLFNRSDELASSWKFITNILDGWEKFKSPLYQYEQGTSGPKEAEELIEKDGRKWI